MVKKIHPKKKLFKFLKKQKIIKTKNSSKDDKAKVKAVVCILKLKFFILKKKPQISSD